MYMQVLQQEYNRAAMVFHFRIYVLDANDNIYNSGFDSFGECVAEYIK